jgi:phage terminase small subunit
LNSELRYFSSSSLEPFRAFFDHDLITKGMMFMAKKLTPKQKCFADNYIILGNATEAALRAGYSKTTARSIGCENLTKPDILEYMEKRLEELEAAKYLDMKEALQITASIARGEGRVQGDYISYPNDSDRLKALDQFYKVNGAFKDKQDITLNMPVMFEGEDDVAD